MSSEPPQQEVPPNEEDGASPEAEEVLAQAWLLLRARPTPQQPALQLPPPSVPPLQSAARTVARGARGRRGGQGGRRGHLGARII